MTISALFQSLGGIIILVLLLAAASDRCKRFRKQRQQPTKPNT